MLQNQHRPADQTPIVTGTIKVEPVEAEQIKMGGISIIRPGFMRPNNEKPDEISPEKQPSKRMNLPQIPIRKSTGESGLKDLGSSGRTAKFGGVSSLKGFGDIAKKAAAQGGGTMSEP